MLISLITWLLENFDYAVKAAYYINNKNNLHSENKLGEFIQYI